MAWMEGKVETSLGEGCDVSVLVLLGTKCNSYNGDILFIFI